MLNQYLIDIQREIAFNFQVDEFISPPPWVQILSFTHVDDVGVYILLTTSPDNFIIWFRDHPSVLANEASPCFVSDIIDIFGRIILNSNVQDNNIRMDVTTLNAGIYLVRVKTADDDILIKIFSKNLLPAMHGIISTHCHMAQIEADQFFRQRTDKP